ncbi:glutamine synthetase-like [Sphaeramia orbicularis]|uniref:Glutamine synthetase n=1 Tax=Sphaeramia orbicularis TaxID=375764 RepID=A0A673CGQ5_9TELE|nr:glutamine synthetase-like [Sphaeramia orbicularis]
MSIPSETLRLHKTSRNHYLSLPSGEECLVTYVFINERGENLKCKTRTLNHEPAGIEDIPEWYASMGVNGRRAEVTLVPVRMYRDPFTLDPNKLVLCEVVDNHHVPTESNKRSQCAQVMEKVKHFEAWFGMEQEYVLFDLDGQLFGWPSGGCKFPQGSLSCAVGLNKVRGRDICISHYKACLYAGVKIDGSNAEGLPAQWEFQVGPCEGTEMSDDLWMARYILHRVCEDFGVVASLDVKPIKEKKWTSGCHINFSTKDMRAEGGLQYIEEAVRQLSLRHSEHLLVYDPHGGADNMRRLTSGMCTSSFHEFSAGTGSRSVSVRIPGHVNYKNCGYLEDRRPASNCDPYSVIEALVETCLLGTSEEHHDNDKKTVNTPCAVIANRDEPMFRTEQCMYCSKSGYKWEDYGDKQACHHSFYTVEGLCDSDSYSKE